MTFDEFWKHYVGGDKDKSLETGRIYAASAWDYQQARIEALEAAARVIVNENTHKQFSHDCGYKTVFANYDRVRDAIDALAALLDSEPSAHTCNASCQRPACVQRRRVEVLEGRLKAYELHYGVMSGAAIQHILNSGHGNNLTEKEWIEAKSEQEGE